eukprot:CAMPEP_0203764834 /NCGR_PEP_ID=MMETSP0098-20131031/18076_1 /ASSEMBLY_ACC=CAM_ASM_000208 /TAXON_ID=96639 /ORGANISM=" , Strain NY0313808BC1" /LENGTH=458 /DNA_ID=CAMNT_0050661023 /DNA_START=559 /DNA_END=1932 /DNA_ORIENTATION=+
MVFLKRVLLIQASILFLVTLYLVANLNHGFRKSLIYTRSELRFSDTVVVGEDVSHKSNVLPVEEHVLADDSSTTVRPVQEEVLLEEPKSTEASVKENVTVMPVKEDDSNEEDTGFVKEPVLEEDAANHSIASEVVDDDEVDKVEGEVEVDEESAKPSTWSTVLLAEREPVQVYSFTERKKEDQQTCSNRTKRKLTIILNSYGPFQRNKTNSHLVWLINMYIRELEPILDRVILSWNPTHENTVDILNYLDNRVPVELVLHNTNRLHNRFAFGNYSCTNHVLHLDNDALIEPRILLSAYRMYTVEVSDRILGFYCADYRLNKTDPSRVNYYSRGIRVRNRRENDACKFALTGAAFLRTKYHIAYFRDKFKKLRDEIVEKYFTGEDIMMNFVVGYELNKHLTLSKNTRLHISGNRKNTAKPVGSNLRVGSAVHFAQHKCFQNGIATVEYGQKIRKGKALW